MQGTKGRGTLPRRAREQEERTEREELADMATASGDASRADLRGGEWRRRRDDERARDLDTAEWGFCILGVCPFYK